MFCFTSPFTEEIQIDLVVLQFEKYLNIGDITMSKKILLILSIFILLIIAVIFMINRGPSAEQQAIHAATVCNTIIKSTEDFDKKSLLEQTRFNFENSTPSYAYNKPKFYEAYAAQMIDHYFTLDQQEQLKLKQEYQYCFNQLSKAN